MDVAAVPFASSPMIVRVVVEAEAHAFRVNFNVPWVYVSITSLPACSIFSLPLISLPSDIFGFVMKARHCSSPYCRTCGKQWWRKAKATQGI